VKARTALITALLLLSLIALLEPYLVSASPCPWISLIHSSESSHECRSPRVCTSFVNTVNVSSGTRTCSVTVDENHVYGSGSYDVYVSLYEVGAYNISHVELVDSSGSPLALLRISGGRSASASVTRGSETVSVTYDWKSSEGDYTVSVYEHVNAVSYTFRYYCKSYPCGATTVLVEAIMARGGSDDGGGGGGWVPPSPPAGAVVYLRPVGLPSWLYSALVSNAGRWVVGYAYSGGYSKSGEYAYQGIYPSGAMPAIMVNVSENPVGLVVRHLGLHYSPVFNKSLYYWGCGKAVASVSRSASYTRLYMRAWFTSGLPGCRVYARAVFTLSDPHVGYGNLTYYVGSGGVTMKVSNGTGWLPYGGSPVLVKGVALRFYKHGSGSGTVYVSNLVPLRPVRWVLTWNGTDPYHPEGNGTIIAVSSGDAFRGNLTRNGAYTLIAYFTTGMEPLLPGVLLLPGLGPGQHRLAGGFEALLVNVSGGSMRLWRAELPLEVDVPADFTWRSLRCPGGHMAVDTSNVDELPLAEEGYFLALEAPATLGPVELCVDANCTWYNVTRLVLSLGGVEYNATHLIVRLRPGYECCPATPVREHLVYVLQLGDLTPESPRDTPLVAVPISLLERLGPGPLHAELYARYSPGGRVPLQIVNVTILRGSVKLVAVQGSTLIFSRPYLWPAYYTSFTPQPWSGPPGTLWVRVGDAPWARAEWNGTNFTYTYPGSLDGAEVEFYWAPPPTDKLVIPLVQKWVLGRW